MISLEALEVDLKTLSDLWKGLPRYRLCTDQDDHIVTWFQSTSFPSNPPCVFTFDTSLIDFKFITRWNPNVKIPLGYSKILVT